MKNVAAKCYEFTNKFTARISQYSFVNRYDSLSISSDLVSEARSCNFSIGFASVRPKIVYCFCNIFSNLLYQSSPNLRIIGSRRNFHSGMPSRSPLRLAGTQTLHSW